MLGKKLFATLLPPDGGPALPFSTRSVMDRVQAMARSLGNLCYDLSEPENSVFTEGGRIRSCGPGAKRSITIYSGGNRIDVPVTLRITTESGNITPVSGRFSSSCLPIWEQRNRLHLEPGELIEAANNLSVIALYKGCRRQSWDRCVDAVWTADLPETTSDGKSPYLELLIRMTFQANGQDFHLESKAGLNTPCDLVPQCAPAPSLRFDPTPQRGNRRRGEGT